LPQTPKGAFKTMQYFKIHHSLFVIHYSLAPLGVWGKINSWFNGCFQYKKTIFVHGRLIRRFIFASKHTEMNLSEIIAVAGQSGLFKTIAQSKNSVIVESIVDKKRMPVYATQRVHTLEAISVYCTDKDVPLVEVFKKISEKTNKGPAIEHKADEPELLKYFGEVLPDFDKERVHISDVRKLIQWYNILQKADMLNFDEVKPGEGEEGKVALPVENMQAKPTHQKTPKSAGKPRTQSASVQKQTVRKTGAA
jgi:hypothetical protein